MDINNAGGASVIIDLPTDLSTLDDMWEDYRNTPLHARALLTNLLARVFHSGWTGSRKLPGCSHSLIPWR